MSSRGIMLVLSSPSGGGKTTLCHRLVQENGGLDISISYTTRPARGTEQDGVDYHFVAEEQFAAMVDHDRFAEWAWVHGNRYGTSRETVDRALDAGRDLVFDIDWQGGYQLKDRYPHDTVLVFVLPPTLAELARRLRCRGTDSAEVIQRRLQVSREEMEHHVRYDYLVVNDDLERAHADLGSIYRVVHLTRARQAHHVAGLLAELERHGP